MFEGFAQHRLGVAGGAAAVDLLTAGAGPPLVLLHGFPQTRATWHLVAPRLARDVTVVVPDLRGYGRSPGPAPGAAGEGYSKRKMAADIAEAMAALGHDRFSVAGHDRGARVAYRLALDSPARVAGLVLFDILTTLDTWEAMDWQAALRAYHWPFLAQEAAWVEGLLAADPEGWLAHFLARWGGPGFAPAPAAAADYRAAICRAEVRAAMAADYRAGAGADVAHDRADRAAGRRLACPVALLRGTHYMPAPAMPAWERWGAVAAEATADCGHFLQEEAPETAMQVIRRHLATV